MMRDNKTAVVYLAYDLQAALTGIVRKDTRTGNQESREDALGWLDLLNRCLEDIA